MNPKVGVSCAELSWFLTEKYLSLEQCKNKMAPPLGPASSCLVLWSVVHVAP